METTTGKHTTNEASTNSRISESDDSQAPDRLVGPFGIEPAHVFFIASLPLGLGAYSGFQKQVKHAEKEAKELAHRMSLEKSGKPLPPLKFSVDGRVLAARAFAIGTMLSLGSFSVVGAFSFYICGFRSFQEAFDSCRTWGRKQKADIEEWSGIDFSKDDPDKIATQNMSEDEEIEYVQKKYLSDEIMQKDTNSKISKWIRWMG